MKSVKYLCGNSTREPIELTIHLMENSFTKGDDRCEFGRLCLI